MQAQKSCGRILEDVEEALCNLSIARYFTACRKYNHFLGNILKHPIMPVAQTGRMLITVSLKRIKELGW